LIHLSNNTSQYNTAV